jgi:serine/threonine-protein kinase RsbW
LGTLTALCEDMADNQSGATRGVERLLESTLESVDVAEELALAIAGEAGFEEESLHKIGMAVREAVVNAVVHGNRYNLNKKVRFLVSSDGERLSIEVSDQGGGFEQQALPDPLAEENLLRQSGRGLLLIRAFADEFEIKTIEQQGTKVRLVFNRQQRDNQVQEVQA